MLDVNIDAQMRAAAFEHVRQLSETHEYLTSAELRPGFLFQGQRIPLVNPQRGIHKPQAMRFLLSIRTIVPRAGARIWYDDQRDAHSQIYSGDDSVDYAFMGRDPNAPDNVALREAMENQKPIIYFLGIAPGKSKAIFPVFVEGWNSAALSARITFGLPNQYQLPPLQAVNERRYALREVKQRLHQASFREAVIAAYKERCALSGLPEPLLLDAAHIVSDKDEQYGHPVVQNGLPLSKIHHAAFDSHLIGVDPDYKIHVSDRLLTKRDGPMLEALKLLNGGKLRLPSRKLDWPDPDRLALRFDQFKKAA